ncbi:MAG: CDP-alcohol phosphatidyltransferase family protein [Bacteroidota bacterium]
MKKHIPNFITLLNLMAGVLAIWFSTQGEWKITLALILAAAVFDFLDGMAARVLKAGSPIGKQLDSLSDMVSFGVLPAFLLYQVYRFGFTLDQGSRILAAPLIRDLIGLSVLMIPAAAAIRLARFNLYDQGDGIFSGLATPANTLFWAGIYAEVMKNGQLYDHPDFIWFLLIVQVLLTVLMILPVPMFSLKFRNFRLKENFIRYFFLLLALILLIAGGLQAFPVIILCYILLSFVNFFAGR